MQAIAMLNDIVRRLMRRDLSRKPPGNLAHPVLVVEGAHGAGKTSALRELEKAVAVHQIPCARVDFQHCEHETVPAVLLAVAAQLARISRTYGGFGFPLLTIAGLALAADLPATQPEARDVIRAMLREKVDIRSTEDLLHGIADSLAGAPLPFPLNSSIPILTEILLAAMRRWRTLSPAWYGHRDRAMAVDPYDVLVELNRSAERGDTQSVNALVWEVFLADLRHEFRQSPRAGAMTLNCVVLVDNADTALGREFVHGLVEARRERPAYIGGDADRVPDVDRVADPVTVVVTSRGGLIDAHTERLLEFSGGLSDHALDYDEFDVAYLWCRYLLPDLGADGTHRMVSGLQPPRARGIAPIGNRQLSTMVYELCAGHRGASATVVAALQERPLLSGQSLALVLAGPEPGYGGARGRLEDTVRASLLGDFPEEAYADLVTCAAARTYRHAAFLATGSGMLTSGLAYLPTVTALLWPEAGGAGPVVLRRLLLRELAARPAGATDWPTVFAWLRDHCQDGAEEVLPYAMAVGDIDAVCAGVRAGLVESGDTATGLALLHKVAAAPRRPCDPVFSAMAQVDAALVGCSDPDALTKLVVELWVSRDPLLSDIRATLHRQIAVHCDTVVGTVRGDPEPLLSQAEQHRKHAEFWS
ncbi:hypothetical protein ACSVDM_02185 [Nocardia sp. JW2]|uniref:hypothetical protein n=1 Tax=Nocardia sp. JW2 TaxID=3450738 RepID=UPI003F43148B